MGDYHKVIQLIESDEGHNVIRFGYYWKPHGSLEKDFVHPKFVYRVPAASGYQQRRDRRGVPAAQTSNVASSLLIAFLQIEEVAKK